MSSVPAGKACLDRRQELVWLVLYSSVYGLALFLLRPASPFEWDEVLFQGALDRYDVGAHVSHPPGYPAYVAAGRAVRFLVGDPLLALQFVGIAAAVMAVAWVYVLARRLGAGPGPAAAAGGLLAVTPAFAFNANVGLSDVLGAAAAVATVLLLVRAWDDPRAMPVAAAVCAAGMAVRPQVAAASLLVGIAALVRAVRAGRWRWVRAGRGRLAAVAAASGFGYLVLAVFTLSFTTSVRYVLPAMPFLLLLAAGSVSGDRRAVRRAGAAVVVVWAIAVTARDWSLFGTGTTELPENASSRLVTVRAGTNALRVAVAGRAEQTVLQGEALAVELTPGKAGTISVSPPANVTTRLDPVRLDRLDPGVALAGAAPPRPDPAPGGKGATLP